MTIYLLLSKDNVVYGYHTQPLELDNVVELEIEFEQQTYIEKNIGHLKLENGKLVELKKPNFNKIQRMAEIKARLEALDIKTYKFIDGELSKQEYEPYKLEKIALRKEYNDLEA